MLQFRYRLDEKMIWEADVKTLSDENLFRILECLDRERSKLQKELLSREGVCLEKSPVLPHTQNLRDVA